MSTVVYNGNTAPIKKGINHIRNGKFFKSNISDKIYLRVNDIGYRLNDNMNFPSHSFKEDQEIYEELPIGSSFTVTI